MIERIRTMIVGFGGVLCNLPRGGAWRRPVLCRVSHEALQDLANRVHFDGTDEKIFEVYRELIERVASDAYDAGTSVDDAGLVLVTAEASPEWAAAREEAALISSSSLP